MYNDKLPITNNPNQILQQSTFHLGVVRDVKDPSGRGRVRVECPSLWDKGEKNWSYWCEICAFPVGSSYRDGDHGIWWTPVPGERVLVGFIAGEHHGAFCIPGPPWQVEPGEKQEIIPLEAKKITDRDVREGTRIRQIKSEAGHTWFMDDNGKSECMFVCDWTGAGLFFDAPGKKEDVKEEKNGPSYFRSAERRMTRTAFAQTSKKPSEIIEGGTAFTGLMDLNGQGISLLAKDDKGLVAICANKEKGENGPSIILDADNDMILLTAGETQLQILGKKGYIAVTRQIILETQLIKVKEFFQALWDRLKNTFKRYHQEKSNDQGQGLPRGSIIV